MGNCFSNIDKIDNSKFNKFSLNGITTKCKILSIYDGDTITIGCKVWHNYFKIKVRMYGYDSPEMKPPRNKPGRDLEIEKAKKAKKFLNEITKNKNLKIEFLDFDKYGRALGNLYIIQKINCVKSKDVLVNKIMIDNNHGYPYFGGTKKN